MKNIMYHATNKKNKEKILSEGLLKNKDGGFTAEDFRKEAYKMYGSNPIFLSEEINYKDFDIE
jgi:hypothetical protein